MKNGRIFKTIIALGIAGTTILQPLSVAANQGPEIQLSSMEETEAPKVQLSPMEETEGPKIQLVPIEELPIPEEQTGAAATAQNPEKEISKNGYNSSLNNYLFQLNYDKNELLRHNGEAVGNLPDKTGRFIGDEFVVVENIKHKLDKARAEFYVGSINSGSIFPGQLLKVDQNLLKNTPTPIYIERAPLTISVKLPGLINGSGYETVANPGISSIENAVNNILDRWHNNVASGYQSNPADFKYDIVNVTNEHQLKAELGVDLKQMSIPLNVDFNAVVNGKKQSCVVNIRQAYYNVAIDVPTSPAGFFGPNVTPEDLELRGINSQTPPAYVSNVTYGRSIFMCLESENRDINLKLAADAIIKGVQGKISPEYRNIFEEVTVKGVVVGGNSGDAFEAFSAKSVEDIKEILKKGSVFDKRNPGVPIAYRVAFLKDSEDIRFVDNTEYVETKVTAFRRGKLILKHTGGYVAKFNISWDEVEIVDGEERVVAHKTWEHNGAGRTSGFSTEIELKPNVRNLSVSVDECTGLAWEWWRRVYTATDLPLVKERTIWVWGTTLNPKYSDEYRN